MTDRECDELMELEDMLGESEANNAILRERLEDTTADLVITMEKLVTLQEKYIDFLEPK